MFGVLVSLAQEAGGEETLPSWVLWATFVSFVLGMLLFAVQWVRAKRDALASGPETTPDD